MFDETQNKIIQAAMTLLMERGYSATTTKDIAARAGVNECTIFRKFKGKKEIILSAMELPQWNPKLSETDFHYCGNLEDDLIFFAEKYMEKVTPKMVKVSMGLRTPELYGDTADGILKIPQVFLKVLTGYFKEMGSKGKLGLGDPKGLAMQFLCLNFGFVFLKASFGDKLTPLSEEAYIRQSVHTFLEGIAKESE
ncbi:MAG: TetR/AcrR family transcriptional regulator [Blautia sp.]|jgi:hypothetical protein